jgi:hypothetical protein
MALAHEEKFRTVSGDLHQREIGFLVTGATDDITALDYLLGQVAPTYDNMPLEDLKLTEIKWPDTFAITAVYSRRSHTPADTGAVEYSFDFALQTQRVYQAKDSTPMPLDQGLAPGFTAEDFEGAIAPDVDGNPQGIDVRTPQSSFSYSYYPANAVVTTVYQRAIQRMVGKVNSTAFHGYDPGEVMFVGASGRARNNDDWQIDFRFEQASNETGVVVGNCTPVDVDGWDVLSISYAEIKGTDNYIQVPRQVDVLRVYDRADFATVLGI